MLSLLGLALGLVGLFFSISIYPVSGTVISNIFVNERIFVHCQRCMNCIKNTDCFFYINYCSFSASIKFEFVST